MCYISFSSFGELLRGGILLASQARRMQRFFSPDQNRRETGNAGNK
jgi:hypothetical protein